ncbi:MAG: DNA mismatch repair protein MutL, partial [Porcipelethomonas sp.]
SCVYFAVKNALMASGLIYEFQFKDDMKKRVDYTAQPFEPEKFEQQKIEQPEKKEESVFTPVSGSEYAPVSEEKADYETGGKAEDKTVLSSSVTQYGNGGRVTFAEPAVVIEYSEDEEESESSQPEEKLETFSYINSSAFVKKEVSEPESVSKESEREQITVIGEFFKNYIAAQAGENIILIDKHAAHERVIFEKLKAQNCGGDSQLTLESAEILLAEAEYNAMLENRETLVKMGFDIDFSHEPFVRTAAVPVILENLNMDEVIPEIAENFLLNKKNPQTHQLDDMFHELACKAAIKANDKNDIKELQRLAEEVYYNENIRHCPHGRPVMFTLSKRDLEKQFKRIV